MSAKVHYVTTMTEIPKNCNECKLEFCTKPCWDYNISRIKKAYLTKRPKDCPLIEVEAGEISD